MTSHKDEALAALKALANYAMARNPRLWRYQSARIGWTKVVVLPLPRDFTLTLRCFESGGYWSAAVYRGTCIMPSALVPGSRSRHESQAAAQRKLLAWVRQRAMEGAHA